MYFGIAEIRALLPSLNETCYEHGIELLKFKHWLFYRAKQRFSRNSLPITQDRHADFFRILWTCRIVLPSTFYLQHQLRLKFILKMCCIKFRALISNSDLSAFPKEWFFWSALRIDGEVVTTEILFSQVKKINTRERNLRLQKFKPWVVKALFGSRFVVNVFFRAWKRQRILKIWKKEENSRIISSYRSLLWTW